MANHEWLGFEMHRDNPYLKETGRDAYLYRGEWGITLDPDRSGRWAFVHVDYDGPDDPRHGEGLFSVAECINEIEMDLDEERPEPVRQYLGRLGVPRTYAPPRPFLPGTVEALRSDHLGFPRIERPRGAGDPYPKCETHGRELVDGDCSACFVDRLLAPEGDVR